MNSMGSKPAYTIEQDKSIVDKPVFAKQEKKVKFLLQIQKI